ncbi:MAG: hypothetical protein M1821_001979 [Bathelium mastoideum]|nr:MAG: hypothetical protein M1821_001979 [Bathelium mastoideum]
MPPENLPYWQVNVPESKRLATCPDFLADANEKDRGILSTRDKDYHRQTWTEVQQFIETNHLELFQRVPSDLRRYKEYTWKLKKEYGSVMNFVLQERLRWKDMTCAGPPFAVPDDYKILYNDWPYGLEPDIVHLVAWTKFDLEDDSSTDDLTPEARKQIDDFVGKTFRSRVPCDQVIWFKNWKSLKSIHAVEHFHVMLYKPDMDFVREITHNDIPLAVKVQLATEGLT